MKSIAGNKSGRFIFEPFKNHIHKGRQYSHIFLEASVTPGPVVLDNLLNLYHIEYDISKSDRENIPRQGPVIVVSNRLFGGYETLILGKLLGDCRKDVKIFSFFSNPGLFPPKENVICLRNKNNRRSSPFRHFGEAKMWLASGKAMVCPLMVSPAFKLGGPVPFDSELTSYLCQLTRETGVNILPVYISQKGQVFLNTLRKVNSSFFKTIPAPSSRKNDRWRFDVFVGRPITWNRMRRYGEDLSLGQFIKTGIRFLGNRNCEKKRVFPLFGNANRPESKTIDIVDQACPVRIHEEIGALPAGQKLINSREYSVYYAESKQIPELLKEIGRMREVTFREVDEGTGESTDLDRFDTYYLHLFLYNEKKRELVGAYRLGPADRILEKHGTKGLYTRTLFNFDKSLLDQFGHSIEIGRSFIRPEYQKKYNSLFLLWQGIARFVARNPKYRVLFGPVSISRNYEVVSKNLIIKFLKYKRFDRNLSRYVTPKNPYRGKKVKGINKAFINELTDDIDDVSLLISEIERDGKGVPILLRHYLKLNARLIGFNIDPAFSRVIDGLIVVDLAKTEPKILKRFMGEAEYDGFARYHQLG